VAPAGSYLDKGIGKLCQKGTYSTGLNSNTNCIPCPDSITTAAEGSTTADACSLAVKGYYISPNNAAEAIKCPLDTYQDQGGCCYFLHCLPQRLEDKGDWCHWCCSVPGPTRL
jgi:hypothetical protein